MRRWYAAQIPEWHLRKWKCAAQNGYSTRESPENSSQGDEITLEIDGQHVKCTRLTKVLYPAVRFTKADVIDYYVRVAPFLLPHLRNRPVTLKRYPDGVTGEAYWNKDAPSFTPEWVETFPVPRHAGGPDIDYVLIQNTATLAWAANAAALELHPFLHQAPAIASPTSIVFDLDPGAGADIRQCISGKAAATICFDARDLGRIGSKTEDLYFEPKAGLARLESVGDLFADGGAARNFPAHSWRLGKIGYTHIRLATASEDLLTGARRTAWKLRNE